MELIWTLPVAVLVVAAPLLVGAARGVREALRELEHELGRWRQVEPAVIRVRDDAAAVRAHIRELRHR